MRRIFLFVFALIFFGIGGFPPVSSAFDMAFSGQEPPDEQEAVLQTAEELAANGEYTQAVFLLRSFVEGHADSPLVAEAQLAMARIYLDKGDHLEALLTIEQIADDRKNTAYLLVEGAALIAAGAVDEGSEQLLSLDTADLSNADRLRRFSALGRAAERQGRWLEALALYHQGSLNAPDKLSKELLARSHRILAEKLSDEQLAETAFMFGGQPVGQDAILQRARRQVEVGKTESARQLVDQIIASPVPFPYHQEAIALWEELTGETWLKRAIGVMLPESGRYATFGALVRRGMELAQQIQNEGEVEPIRLIYTNTAADAGKSADLVSELANRERVMAIAGPLTGSSAMAAAERAQQLQVPLLTLSQREGLPETGEFVFRNSLTSRLQARALARYAVLEQGLTGFGVLYPDNRLGRELTEIFAEEVLKLGGLVVAKETYDEKATDFGRQIKRLKGEDPDAPEVEESLSGQDLLEDLFLPDEPEFPPVDFDALFIPDYADRVALIAPQLVFYGIENVPLLGINGWNSPELTRSAGRFVEGAVFVDGFFRYSGYPFVQDFVNRYFDQYGEEPTILEAQGFDVASILLTLAKRPEMTSREALRLALDQLESYPGVTGATSFDLHGDADKVLFLLQIQNGNIVQIN